MSQANLESAEDEAEQEEQRALEESPEGAAAADAGWKRRVSGCLLVPWSDASFSGPVLSAKKQRVSWEGGVASPPPSRMRMQQQARLMSIQQEEEAEEEERKEREAARRKRKAKRQRRLGIRRGSKKNPSAAAAAVARVEGSSPLEYLYVALTNDTLWRRRFGSEEGDDSSAAWEEMGPAVSVCDLAVDAQSCSLFALDLTGAIWRQSLRERCEWEEWDETAPQTPHKRRIAVLDGEMWALDDSHVLLRTPLQPTPPTPTAALAESLVASAAGVTAVGKRKWSAVPLEVLEEGGPRAIALTDHLGCLLLASEDGTVHALQPAQDPAAALCTVEAKIPTLPKDLCASWLSLGGSQRPSDDAAATPRLFATAAGLADKAAKVPRVHYLAPAPGDDRGLWADGGEVFGADGQTKALERLGSGSWQRVGLTIPISTLPAQKAKGNQRGSKKRGRSEGPDGEAAQGYLDHGHEWIGAQIQRMLVSASGDDLTIVKGTIVKWMPAASSGVNKGPAFWRVQFEASAELLEEDLEADEARDAIGCATEEGGRELAALRERLLSLESVARERRDDFIRRQPAYAEDVRAGHNTLICGYKVWAKFGEEWWPAELMTPIVYMYTQAAQAAVLSAAPKYSHFEARAMCKAVKPESLFLGYLDKARSYSWASWGPGLSDASICVHDFRLHRARHANDPRLKKNPSIVEALNAADASLSAWKAGAAADVAGGGAASAAGESNASGAEAGASGETQQPASAAPDDARKSRFVGVSWVDQRQKWMAQLGSVQIGVFDDEEAAARAYDAAARRIRGSQAQRLNYPDSEERARSEESSSASSAAAAAAGRLPRSSGLSKDFPRWVRERKDRWRQLRIARRNRRRSAAQSSRSGGTDARAESQPQPQQAAAAAAGAEPAAGRKRKSPPTHWPAATAAQQPASRPRPSPAPQPLPVAQQAASEAEFQAVRREIARMIVHRAATVQRQQLAAAAGSS